jgi:hypothetical protein
VQLIGRRQRQLSVSFPDKRWLLSSQVAASVDRGGCEMNEDTKRKYDPFNPKSIGEPVNSHVHRISPQKELDYIAIQRFIEASVQVGPSTKVEKKSER